MKYRFYKDFFEDLRYDRRDLITVQFFQKYFLMFLEHVHLLL
jgi:hypothetical protein